MSLLIFSHLTNIKDTKKINSKSFVQDIKLLERNFGLEISAIFENPLKLKYNLKKKFVGRSGLADSINTCLNHYKSKTYKLLLEGLTKTSFIREEEEFQELLQYLIIEGYS